MGQQLQLIFLHMICTTSSDTAFPTKLHTDKTTVLRVRAGRNRHPRDQGSNGTLDAVVRNTAEPGVAVDLTATPGQADLNELRARVICNTIADSRDR